MCHDYPTDDWLAKRKKNCNFLLEEIKKNNLNTVLFSNGFWRFENCDNEFESDIELQKQVFNLININ